MRKVVRAGKADGEKQCVMLHPSDTNHTENLIATGIDALRRSSEK